MLAAEACRTILLPFFCLSASEWKPNGTWEWKHASKQMEAWGSFNGEREVPESLPARTEMTDDYFLSSGLLVRGTFFFLLIIYSPIMYSWVTVSWRPGSVFLRCCPLWENSSKGMAMSTGLSPRRGLSWLKADSWSDGLSWIYWNPPKSSRPGLTDTAPPLPELGAQRWGAQAPQHPRWRHGVATVQGAIDSLALLKLQRSHLPPLLGSGNHPTFIVWSVFFPIKWQVH